MATCDWNEMRGLSEAVTRQDPTIAQVCPVSYIVSEPCRVDKEVAGRVKC